MATAVPSRSEPILDPGPLPVVGTPPEKRLETVPIGAASGAPAEASASGPLPASGPLSAGGDQLSRIEDKAARIEEKFARQEATALRVLDRFDAAAGRMAEVATQSELAAVRGEVGFIARRVRRLPGFGALVVTAVLTSVLTAALTIAIVKYVPGLLAR